MGIQLTCTRCGTTWIYRGKASRATCANASCKRKVRVLYNRPPANKRLRIPKSMRYIEAPSLEEINTGWHEYSRQLDAFGNFKPYYESSHSAVHEPEPPQPAYQSTEVIASSEPSDVRDYKVVYPTGEKFLPFYRGIRARQELQGYIWNGRTPVPGPKWDQHKLARQQALQQPQPQRNPLVAALNIGILKKSFELYRHEHGQKPEEKPSFTDLMEQGLMEKEALGYVTPNTVIRTIETARRKPDQK